MDKITLNDNKKIPIIGFGTWLLKGKKDIFQALNAASEAGYNHLIQHKFIIMKRKWGLSYRKKHKTFKCIYKDKSMSF